MEICRIQSLLRHSETKIQNERQMIEDQVNKCQICQVTNTVSNPKNP